MPTRASGGKNGVLACTISASLAVRMLVVHPIKSIRQSIEIAWLSLLHHPHDGLKREFKSSSQSEAGMCTMCALGDQEIPKRTSMSSRGMSMIEVERPSSPVPSVGKIGTGAKIEIAATARRFADMNRACCMAMAVSSPRLSAIPGGAGRRGISVLPS